MSLDHFVFKVVTPEGPVFEEKGVTFSKIPGAEGEVGVYPNHTSTITSLTFGEVVVLSDTLEQSFYLGKGIAHIEKDSVTILTPFIEAKNAIDIERAQASKKRAEERLLSRSSDIDRDRARLALKRAQMRLRVALGEVA